MANELKTGDKIVQQMTRDGAVEINKATGGAENISARETAAPEADSPGTAVVAVADRVISERGAQKKRAVKRANQKIYESVHQPPEFHRKGRVADPPQGKTATRLSFRERDQPPNGKLNHRMNRPGREAALAVHGEIDRSNADGNTGVQAAHYGERAAEGAARKIGDGYEHMKFRPERTAAKAQQKTVKQNVDALYQRSLRLNPELAQANPIQKALHKRKIKRDYVKSFRQGNRAGATAAKAAQKAKQAAGSTGKFIVKHGKGLAIIGGFLGVVVILVAGFGSCSSMFSGMVNGVVGTSYTAENPEITGADADYTALENGLAAEIEGIESSYPGYDEYRYFLDEIGHDPYELASYLTAKFNSYTREQVQAELAALFAQQYTLTLDPVTEIRYREETYTDTWTDPETGETYTDTYTVQVPYEYYILNVTLTNKSLGAVALANLTPEQAEMYLVYMETKGNKPELFGDNVYVDQGDYTDYDIPPEALTDSTFAAMIQEAEKYLGMAYVWGGSSPTSGFDCSGYVSWVINQSGAGSVGRMTASGLLNHCAVIAPGEAQPGDLIFFENTYDSAGPASHVGIYVGGGMMIHCGNPISYASVTTDYWQSHFLAYGRLP
jgi:cell wall-associated NlpC family hydrolase